MGELALILSAVSTGAGILGGIQSGKQEQQALKFQEQQAKIQGDEALAVSQREAQARHRQGRILLSDQRAAGAASSGDTNDQSVLDIAGLTNREINLNTRNAINSGLNQQRGFEDRAKVARFDRRNVSRNTTLGVIGQGLQGASSLSKRFGGSFPKSRKLSGSFFDRPGLY